MEAGSTSQGILLKILLLASLVEIPEDVYKLMMLTHVCRSWRSMLTNSPQIWAKIFVTRGACRDVVEMCLERSAPDPLEITVDVSEYVQGYRGCTCHGDYRGRLLPSDTAPCERHFVFESLAELRHSTRVLSLNITFYPPPIPAMNATKVALGSCRFFTSTFPQLVNLTWDNGWGLKFPDYLFSTPPFPQTLRRLTFKGPWSDYLATITSLTFFKYEGNANPVDPVAFQRFLVNNPNLESLWLKQLAFQHNPGVQPVELPSLKRLSVNPPPVSLSAVIQAPAVRNLSSLRIWLSADRPDILSAAGDGFILSAGNFLRGLDQVWHELTWYARPVIGWIRVGGSSPDIFDRTPSEDAFRWLIQDASTVEVRLVHGRAWNWNLWGALMSTGTQLKVVRVEVPEPIEQTRRHGDLAWDGDVFGRIDQLVRYRFESGSPLTAVERLVVNDDDRINGEQDTTWNQFYRTRDIASYLR